MCMFPGQPTPATAATAGTDHTTASKLSVPSLGSPNFPRFVLPSIFAEHGACHGRQKLAMSGVSSFPEYAGWLFGFLLFVMRRTVAPLSILVTRSFGDDESVSGCRWCWWAGAQRAQLLPVFNAIWICQGQKLPHPKQVD